jgi:hypothetical protein
MWTKSAAFAACAALISLAVVPALAQPEEVGAQSPPAEVQEVQPGTERVSRPTYEEGTDRALQLRAGDRMSGRKCRSGADSEAEAVEDCTAKLNCPAGTAVKCQYRSNNQDWICSCK